MTWYSIQKIASKSVVSFDFDDTLTLPEWDDDNQFYTSHAMNPNKEMIAKLLEEKAAGNKIVIVTSRTNAHKAEVEEFVRKHNLPVSAVYCTGDLKDNQENSKNEGNKGRTLSLLGVARHYDDCEAELKDAEREGIVGIPVSHPQDRLMGVESLPDDLQDEYTLANRGYLIRYLAIESRGENFKSEEEARQWVLKELSGSDLSDREKEIQSRLVPYHKEGDRYVIGLKPDDIGEITEGDKWAGTEIIENDEPGLSGVVLTRISNIHPKSRIPDNSSVDTVVARLKQRPSFFQAVIVDQNNQIIDGDARYHAVSGLGMEYIPAQWKIEDEQDDSVSRESDS